MNHQAEDSAIPGNHHMSVPERSRHCKQFTLCCTKTLGSPPLSYDTKITAGSY